MAQNRHQAQTLEAISPKAVRYIKLGASDSWAEHAIAAGEVPFGHRTIAHELALQCARDGDWSRVVAAFAAQGRSASKARDFTREVRDFYTLGPDCLWVTFSASRLYWSFADSSVCWRGGDGSTRGERYRRVLGSWDSTDIHGRPILAEDLSTRLTKVRAYRQTLCSIQDADYVVRRINGIEEPIVERARSLMASLVKLAGEMIAGLHQWDFEALVDLIFRRSGWQRVSRLGQTERDIDLAIDQTATGERAFVQVKSAADQSVLDDYVGRYEQSDRYDRMFFVCHSPRGTLAPPDDPRVRIWTGTVLASQAVSAGLFDWLTERCK
jgi:hypothetical protein